MFDVGFSELLVVGIVALLVLGPERMPVAVRTLALWLGRLKRSYHHVRAEIEREIGADEIRRQLRNEEIMSSLDSSRKQVQNIAHETSASLQQAEIRKSLEENKKSFQNLVDQVSASGKASSEEVATAIQTPDKK